MAKNAARSQRLDFTALAALQETFPAIAVLRNGNCVVLVGLRDTPDGPAVAVLDPTAIPANAILLIDAARFQEAWSGELVLLKRSYAALDEKQPFGLRWFIT